MGKQRIIDLLLEGYYLKSKGKGSYWSLYKEHSSFMISNEIVDEMEDKGMIRIDTSSRYLSAILL